MVSPEGRTNFQNQLKQLIGSIQYSNDYDVHTALILAPSYAKTIDEKYYQQDKNVWQRCREYVDLFGIMQKNTNALDILIEEARSTLRSWGSQEPSFLLTNPKLTMQMTMTPEKTSYVAHGPEGQKLLKQGPSLPSYRGLNIINSRCFATEEGKRPRDMLDRRVRVAEYYVVSKVPCNSAGKPIYEEDYVELYDQSKDQMFKLTMKQLYDASFLPGDRTGPATTNDMDAFIQNAKKHGIKRPTARFWENNMANPANNKANSYRESKTFQPKTPSGSSKSSAPQMYGLRYGVYANPPAGGTGNTYPTPIEGETVTVRLEAALTGDDGEFWERMVRAAQSEKLIFHEDAFLSKNVELNEVWKEKAQYKGQNPKDFPQSALYHQQSNDDNTNYGAHTFVSYLPTFPEYDDTDDGKAAWAMQNSARPFVYVRAVSAQTGKAKQWLEDIEQLSGTEPFAIPDSVKTAIELIKNHPEKIDPAVAEATDAERPDAEYQAAASLYNNLHLHSALLLQTKAWMAEQSADTQVHSAREALVETTISSEAWKVLVDLNIDVLWWSDRDENKVSAVPNDLADEDIEVTRLYTSAYVSMHFLIACIYHAMDNTPNDKAAFAAMLQDMSYPGVDGQVNLDLTYRSESPNFWTALNGYMTGLKLERVSDYFSVTTGKMFAAFEDTATATAAAPPAPAAPPPPAASPAAPPAPQSAPPGASIAYVESLRDRIAALENAKNDMEAEARTQGQNHRNLETEVKTLEGQLQAYVNAQAAAATAAAGGGGGGGSGGGAAPDPAATATAIAAMQAQITTLTAEAAAAKTSAESARNAATTAGADLIRERRALQTLLATETTRAERAELAEVRRAMNEEAVLRQELADMQTEIASLKAVAGGGAALAAAAGALPAAAVPPEFRDFIVVRPCIEHQMLGVVMGRGGKDELGCTFWGQTELSVYDDSMHGPCPAKLPVCLLLTLLRCLAAAFLLRCRL